MPATPVVLSQLVLTNVITAASCANTAAATSASIDTAGFEGTIVFVQNLGAVTGTITPKLQGSQDNSNFYDVTSVTNTLGTTASAQTQQQVDCRSIYTASTTGPCRYLKYVGTIVTGPSLLGVTMVGFKKVSG